MYSHGSYVFTNETLHLIMMMVKNYTENYLHKK